MNYNYIVESLVNPSKVSWISVREDNSIPETIQNSITHIFSQNQQGKTVIPLLNMPAPTIQARESVAVRISTSGYSFLNYTLTKPTLLVGTPNRFFVLGSLVHPCTIGSDRTGSVLFVVDYYDSDYCITARPCNTTGYSTNIPHLPNSVNFSKARAKWSRHSSSDTAY